MGAGCPRRLAWLSRCLGAAGVITVGVGSFALGGSPQLHERIYHHRAQLIHSCGITLAKSGKCSPAIAKVAPACPCAERPLQSYPLPRTILNPVWVPKLFMEACRFEHGPPAHS